jgi:hypothetical protein
MKCTIARSIDYLAFAFVVLPIWKSCISRSASHFDERVGKIHGTLGCFLHIVFDIGIVILLLVVLAGPLYFVRTRVSGTIGFLASGLVAQILVVFVLVLILSMLHRTREAKDSPHEFKQAHFALQARKTVGLEASMTGERTLSCQKKCHRVSNDSIQGAATYGDDANNLKRIATE